MTEETITLNFHESKLVWNRSVRYDDYESAGGDLVLITAGNESNWIEPALGVWFTDDFYIMLVENKLTSVKLYIKYGAVPDYGLQILYGGEGNANIFVNNNLVQHGDMVNANVALTIKAVPSADTEFVKWILEYDSGVKVNITGNPHLITANTPDIKSFTGVFKLKDVPSLIITNVSATLISAGNIKIKWTQNIPGRIDITRNGEHVFAWDEKTAGNKDWDSSGNVSGTYIFCVNGVCVTFILDCVSTQWLCEEPLNGYEFDGCGHRREADRCDPAIEGLKLSVNNATKTVSVNLNTDVIFEVKGTSGKTVVIKNITAFPDIEVASGTCNSSGIFKWITQFTTDEYIEFQAYGDLLETSNIVKVKIGNPNSGDEFTLSVDNAKINVGESITLTATGKEGKVKFAQKEFIGNTIINTADTVNKVATYTFAPASTRTYVALHSDILGITTWTNDVYVEVVGGGTGWEEVLKYIPYAIGAYIIVSLIQRSKE